MDWNQSSQLQSKSYKCGYCNNSLASNIGYHNRNGTGLIYICHQCHSPTFFTGQSQTPGVLYGNQVPNISDPTLVNIYTEARKCMAVNAFTAAVLCCRKVLMHIGVDKGAAENLSFVQYVEHLSKEGWLPVGSKGWVDYIRLKGNDLNHEIKIATREDAEKLINLTEMLLKLIYEFPSTVPPST